MITKIRTAALIIGIALIFAFSACSRGKSAAAEASFTFENGVITGYTGTDTAVVIPSRIQGQTVVEIGYCALFDKKLTGVTIPDSVATIGDQALAANQLTRVIIPNSVTFIDGLAFDSNPLTSITIGADVELGMPIEGGFLYAFDEVFDSAYNYNGRRAGTYTFNNGAWSLGGIVLEAPVPEIPRHQFFRTIELANPRMNGEDVEALQKRLLALGYDAIGEADGYYGPMTERVIKYIQFFLMLDADGKVDRALWYYIFDDWDSRIIERESFKSNAAIDVSAVVDAFEKFIKWKNANEGAYTGDIVRIDRITDGLLQNREYSYTVIYSYANEDFVAVIRYLLSPENNLVLRVSEVENAGREEYRLLDSGKFVFTSYSGQSGYHTGDELYDYNPRTGSFTLTESVTNKRMMER